MSASHTPEEILDEPTLAPEPGRIVDAELVAGEQLRVTIRHVEGPIQTAYERVETDPHRDDVLQSVRELCKPPDANSTPSTMVSRPALQGALAEKHDMSPDGSAGAIRRAIEARDLACVLWDGEGFQIGEGADGTGTLFPIEEEFVYRVIAEFNAGEAFDQAIIEHCQALLEEVEG